MAKIITNKTYHQGRRDGYYVLNIKRLMRGETFNSPANETERQVRAEAVGDYIRRKDK